MTQQVTETRRVSARGDAWRAIPVMHDRVIGRQRHIVGAGQKVAACGAGVTTSTLWVNNRNKGKCTECLRLAPDPDNTAVIGVRTQAQQEAQRILDRQPTPRRSADDMDEAEYQRLLDRARDVRLRHEGGGWGQDTWGRRDEETRTRPAEKPEWDLRYGYGYPDMPVTERPPAGKWVSEDKVVHTNPHVRLATLDRRLDWADRKVKRSVEDLDDARRERDGLREQIIAARQEAGLCVRCGEQRCACEGEEKG